MKILIPGGAGFIGSHVARALQDRHEVVVIDNFSYGSPANLNEFRGEVIKADIREVRYNQFGQVDAVIHEAAIADNTITDEALVNTNNAEAFGRLLKELRPTGAKIVYISSSAVYGNGPVPMSEGDPVTPTTLYGKSKIRMERIASDYSRETGQPLLGLRYFNAYGAWENSKGPQTSMVWKFAKTMLSGQAPVIFGNGTQKRDFVYIKDMVALTARALEVTYNGVINVGSGRATEFNEVIRALNKVMGASLRPTYTPLPFQQYQHYTMADITRMREVLGREPAFSLEEGLRDMVHELRGRPLEDQLKFQGISGGTPKEV